ncbi:hypothetical protein EMIT047CA2_100071 [Pseudomonas soli]
MLAERSLLSALGNDVNRVHDPGDITQQGQQDVQPERATESHLEKYAQRWQEDSDDDANEVHAVRSLKVYQHRLVAPPGGSTGQKNAPGHVFQTRGDAQERETVR